MSIALLIRALTSLLFGGLLAWDVFARCRPKAGPEGRPQRYQPFLTGILLPLFFFSCLAAGFLFAGPQGMAELTLSLCFGIFLQILFYYLALLAALPLLRRHFSAGACAMLWLLPNYLYITQQTTAQLPRPLFILRAPEAWVWGVFRVWLLGFWVLLGGSILSHLIFRRQILAGAVPVEDPEILALWEQERENTGLGSGRLALVCSDRVTTPLSVGLFRRWMRVVLPRRNYSAGELRLIFRHELTHIGREDSRAKFLLTFCTALCWVNPLIWLAARKSAEDLELSCDEAVLTGCGEAERQQYARLLLNTAGDGRGFTTCLSAAASSLRYRLKNAVKPAKKTSGALLVGLVFFGLSMSCGYVSLAYGGDSGEALLFSPTGPQGYSLRSVSLSDDPYRREWRCRDEKALLDWLGGLELEELTGLYSYESDEPKYIFLLDAPEGSLGLVLWEDSLKYSPLWEGGETQTYHIAGGSQEEALAGLLQADPALNLLYTREGEPGTRSLGATLYRLEAEGPEGLIPLITPPEELWETPSTAYSSRLGRTAELDFSLPLEGGFQVTARELEGDRVLCWEQADLESPFTLPLAEFDAWYALSARLRGQDGTLYRAEFRFQFESGNGEG